MTTLQLAGIAKSYGRTRALRGLTATLTPDGITGIVGPNGAGKSTLMRIVSGEECPDAGELTLDGEPFDPVADRDRIALVHQEPQIWPNLTVAENLVVGRESQRLGRVRASDEDLRILTELDLAGYRDRELELCPLAVRQRVEVARALARRASCFLFDEPNSALTESQSQALFRSMHRLAEQGHLVLLISHRLAEVVRHCTSVLVVRDGTVPVVLEGPELTEAALARELVVGHQGSAGAPGRVPDRVPDRDPKPAPDAAGGAAPDVAVPGVVTAVMGVEGSGARELVAALAEQPRAGRRRVAFLAADRRDTLFPNLTVGENIVARLGRGSIATPGGWLRRTAIRDTAGRWISSFSVKTTGPDQGVVELSGGNQQKLAIAAALAIEPDVLAVEEPTRGVDIGSKADIYAILRDAARRGIAVVLHCTEVPEAYDVADRVLVVERRRIAARHRVADHADLPALAAAIATAEHTLDHPVDSSDRPAEPVPAEGARDGR